MKEYGKFDATSDATPPSGQNSASGAGDSAPRNRRKRIRVIFNCCNVYSVVPIPSRVLRGELASWRIHCPRCGRATEAPV